ncbi:carbohydrate ABC transporter permease [Deinococcus psychrotolerans]|uniref:Carbohydrate ABC transporter permease n=1 Tax=Deinococcus psychrotolerans TaxID=2489213 RepID=A0A3G8YJ88_9DEIO|nr:carbohydrate ABC transporter permease [Deinococcus psychrotolerans]AZI44347.1 carbohydrate ABC transporter permease [Deinococcus psychrotolerans]
MKLVRMILGVLLTLLILGPLMMMISISLNPDEAAINAILGTAKAFIPTALSLQNYKEVITDPYQPFMRYLFNTLFVTICTVGLGVLVNSSAAFALAWGHGTYRKFYLAVIIAVFVIPGEGLLIPLILMMSRLGWLDSYQVQIVPFIASAFSIFLFYQFFSKIPAELIEAARIDGAHLPTIFLKIALPLSKPVIATTAILGFLDVWNSYLWPSMVTRGVEYRPLSVAMAAFFGSQQSYWGNVSAFAVLMALPVIIVFLIFQRWFVASVIGSGVKG